MERYYDCPQVLREFLTYHETIKGQSSKTIQEYYLDLRMFLRFMVLIKNEMPYHTSLDTISIKQVDLSFISKITVSDIFDFLSYLANDRVKFEDTPSAELGIGNAARARKLSAIKSFYKYLTVRTKQLAVNPVQDFEFPKIRKSLPKYLTLEECQKLLRAVQGANEKRDFAILMVFLNCGIRRAELVGLNISDVSDDRIRVVGTKGVLEVRDNRVILTNDRGVLNPENLPDDDMFADFLRHAAGNGPCRISGEEVLEITRAALLAQSAADSGEIICWDR